MTKAFMKESAGHCIDALAILQVSGLFNTISDTLILLLPAAKIWKLQMDVRTKIRIWAVLTLGAV